VFGYSKQAYYKQLHYQEEESFNEYLIVGLIKQKRQIWKRGSGRNLWKSLQRDFLNHRISIGRDKFFDLLRRNGLLIRYKKRRIKTTDSYHRYHKYPNLTKGVKPQSKDAFIILTEVSSIVAMLILRCSITRILVSV